MLLLLQWGGFQEALKLSHCSWVAVTLVGWVQQHTDMDVAEGEEHRLEITPCAALQRHTHIQIAHLTLRGKKKKNNKIVPESRNNLIRKQASKPTAFHLSPFSEMQQEPKAEGWGSFTGSDFLNWHKWQEKSEQIQLFVGFIRPRFPWAKPAREGFSRTAQTPASGQQQSVNRSAPQPCSPAAQKAPAVLVKAFLVTVIACTKNSELSRTFP